MGFITEIFGAAVKTALTPVAVVKDAVNIVTGAEPDTTTSLLESAVDDVADSIDSLSDGDVF
jgi:hypothetical protein